MINSRFSPDPIAIYINVYQAGYARNQRGKPPWLVDDSSMGIHGDG